MDDKPRIPPGQHAIDDLPVLHVGGIPPFDPATWDIRIDGEVANPVRLTYEQLRALPSVISVSDFHCVETWSRLDCAWEGVRGTDICDLVSPNQGAHFVAVGCDGGYSTNLPLQDFLHPDVLLAWGLDGKELKPEHGFPLRLVVPHKYAYKSAKWVRQIRFTQEDEVGYWELRGYSNSADPWQEERYS